MSSVFFRSVLMSVRFRRILFGTLVITSFVALTALMIATLSPGGYGALDLAIIFCFMVTLPWTIIGFWNAAIGLAVMRMTGNPAHHVCPIEKGSEKAGLRTSTAILSCIRNEDVDEVETKLQAMLAGLARSGYGEAFHLYVLSDTTEAEIATREELAVQRLRAHWRGQIEVTYRRRDDNPGFKAGNIEDFCDRWGSAHDFALVLDADSYMSADIILDLVRRMEANPKLGILQSLVVGLPTDSAFARIFQFGMRLGMRSYTIGSAWWQADCGPYWGHNAILRLKPFAEHCRMPKLPGNSPLGGWVLSHDQVEAVMMRRAGYDVRVLPREGGSYEENPPHILEYIRRDLRWCQGNLQYLKLLTMKDLLPVSRIQLVLAILMFAGSPAWIGFMVSAALLGLMTPDGQSPFMPSTGYALFLIILTMVFAPKLATVADILMRKDLRRSFGGPVRILTGTVVEIVNSAMQAPVLAVAHTLFMAGLPFGKAAGWGAQARGNTGLPLTTALTKLWPQTLFGLAAAAWVFSQDLAAVWPVIPVALGPFLAIPVAVFLGAPAVGRLAVFLTLWRIPEETAPPPELAPLKLPALDGHPSGTTIDVPDLQPSEVKA